jgi:hypothetical protein
MKKVRVIEFWTCNPNVPTPTTEEKIRALAQYRTSGHFGIRLDAYGIPHDFSDEQIINWDGAPIK